MSGMDHTFRVSFSLFMIGTAGSIVYSWSRSCLTSLLPNSSTALRPSSHPARHTREAFLLRHTPTPSTVSLPLRDRVSARRTEDTRSAPSRHGCCCDRTSRRMKMHRRWTSAGSYAGSCTCRAQRRNSVVSRDARTSSSMGVTHGGSAGRLRY